MVKYYNELVYYIQRMIGDKEQAVDIIQETYTKTLEKSKKTDIKNERAFLYKVARNIVIDDYRKQKNKIFLSYEEEDFRIPKEDQPEEIALEKVKEEILLEALDTLPKHLKQAFVLHIFDGYSKKEIAKIMNISLNSSQKYVINASKKLASYIENKEWD